MNPFATSMVKLYVPPHMGAHVSVEGFILPVDDVNRCVEVPQRQAAELVQHGLVAIPSGVDPIEFMVEQQEAAARAEKAKQKQR